MREVGMRPIENREKRKERIIKALKESLQENIRLDSPDPIPNLMEITKAVELGNQINSLCQSMKKDRKLVIYKAYLIGIYLDRLRDLDRKHHSFASVLKVGLLLVHSGLCNLIFSGL